MKTGILTIVGCVSTIVKMASEWSINPEEIIEIPKGAVIGIIFERQMITNKLVAYPLYNNPTKIMHVNLVFRDLSKFVDLTKYWKASGVSLSGVYMLKNSYLGTVRESIFSLQDIGIMKF